MNNFNFIRKKFIFLKKDSIIEVMQQLVLPARNVKHWPMDLLSLAFKRSYQHGFFTWSACYWNCVWEYIIFWDSENHKLQPENGFHDPRECGKSQSPPSVHFHQPALPAGPLRISMSPLACVLGTCIPKQFSTHLWKFSISMTINKNNVIIERGIKMG